MLSTKTFITEPRGRAVLFRGHGLLRVLGRFQWAVKDPDGVVVPADQEATARAELESAGWSLLDMGEPHREGGGPRRPPVSLPSCARCNLAYRTPPPAGSHCVRCGTELQLVKHDPEPGDDGPTHCPECRRPVHPGWLFCPCGAQLDTARAERPAVPWRVRYAAILAEFGDKFALPDDVR